LIGNIVAACSFKEPPLPETGFVIVAGGGAGGDNIGGGGGAGGLRALPFTFALSTNYTVTVGAGGTKVAYPTGGNSGTPSTFSTYNVSGGGGGGTFGTTYGPFNGGSGGGSRNNYQVGLGNAGGYSPVEGYNGGQGGENLTSGGGGGASAVGGTGGSGSGSSSGTGGAGASSYGDVDFSGWLTIVTQDPVPEMQLLERLIVAVVAVVEIPTHQTARQTAVLEL